MIRLIHAEFVKIRTTQVWFWLLIAVLAISVLVVVGSFASSDGVKTAADLPQVFASTNSATIATFVLGVLGVTTEFRYKTITSTVLVTPSRWALITAKLIAYALLGAIYALVCIVVELAIAVPWASTKNIDFSLSDPNLRRAIFGLFLVLALFGIIGIGIGALLRNQIVAVTLGMIFLLVIQNILLAIPHVRTGWQFTPSGAVTAILFKHSDAPNNVALLSPIGGVVVLLLWAFIPALLGAGITMNRDIT